MTDETVQYDDTKKGRIRASGRGKGKMYVCGPTVYNFIHIGNARPMIVFDTVRRYFEYKGYEREFCFQLYRRR